MQSHKTQTDVTSAMLSSESASASLEEHSRPMRRSGSQTPSAVIGSIVGLAADGTPLVTWPDALSHNPYPALTQSPIDAGMVGRKCTLLFIGDNPVQPVILGLLHDNQAQTNGYRIVQAEEALILQCGAARIELHDNGRIILQGMQIDSQAYGPYRIKGASVKVN